MFPFIISGHSISRAVHKMLIIYIPVFKVSCFVYTSIYGTSLMFLDVMFYMNQMNVTFIFF